eukprot:14553820-Alexandrium_andersonii.AAC.1
MSDFSAIQCPDSGPLATFSEFRICGLVNNGSGTHPYEVIPRGDGDLEPCALLNEHLQSSLPDGTHWSTIAVGTSIPYSVVRAM